MSVATQDKVQAAPKSPYAPANLDDYQAEKAARLERQKQNRKKMRKYLDGDAAAAAESKKPVYEWSVSCSIDRPDEKTGRMRTINEQRTVRAQTENEAWARFCDAIQTWPSPASVDREIKRGEKI